MYQMYHARAPDATMLISCENPSPEPPVAVSIVARTAKDKEYLEKKVCRMPVTLISVEGTEEG